MEAWPLLYLPALSLTCWSSVECDRPWERWRRSCSSFSNLENSSSSIRSQAQWCQQRIDSVIQGHSCTGNAYCYKRHISRFASEAAVSTASDVLSKVCWTQHRRFIRWWLVVVEDAAWSSNLVFIASSLRHKDSWITLSSYSSSVVCSALSSLSLTRYRMEWWLVLKSFIDLLRSTSNCRAQVQVVTDRSCFSPVFFDWSPTWW